MFRLLTFVFTLTLPALLSADTEVAEVQPLVNKTGSGLDLSVPPSHLEEAPPANNPATITDTAQEKELREHCTELRRQIDALRGQYKLQRRAALVERHKLECTDQAR